MGEKTHVYRVIILKQMADHIYYALMSRSERSCKTCDFLKATCEICRKNRQSDDFNFLITCVFSQFFAILMITKVKATSGFYNICEQVWRGFFGSIAIFCSSVFHVNDHFDLSRCWFYKIYEKKRKITSQTIFLLFWQFLVIVIKAYLHAKANAAP